VPLGVLCALIALADVVALVFALVQGDGYYIGLAALQGIFFGGLAYTLGVELPRNVRGWDEALAERRALEAGEG
jgi:hypothetical protein